MKIVDAQYIISCVKRNQFPTPHLPEFIFFGRSNVGKSSFINALSNRKNLAYTSSKPGKTLTLNFYLINKSFYFIDVPGYGYAERSENTRLDFGKMIEDYLSDKTNLEYAFLIIDAKVGFTEDDILMFKFLLSHDVRPLIIATKIDKLNQKESNESIKRIVTKLNDNSLDAEVFLVSSLSKVGIDQVLDKIEESLN